MSREGQFSFTQLVEEDEDVADIGDPYLDLELQPHLSTFNSSKGIGNTRFKNGNNCTNQETMWQSTFQGFENPAVQLGKKFQSERQEKDSSVFETMTNTRSSSPSAESSVKNDHESSEHYKSDQSSYSNVMNTAQKQSIVHIQYSSTEGKVNVMQGKMETRTDGSRYINTQEIPQQWSESERPLRQRKIKFLKIFSIVAFIVFFPFGIPAVYFAFRTETEFNEGIMKGNIDRAQKFANRTVKFIVISFIMFVVIAALVVTVVFTSKDRNIPRGPVIG